MPIMIKYLFLGIALLGLLASTQGCVSTAPVPQGGPVGGGEAVAAAARSVLGAPYRYGGRSPRGFDCSGLVHYAHQQAGIAVPRTTLAQRRAARPVSLADLRPGDVLFFDLDGSKVSHVGIYAGRGRFIHAPSSGKRVAYAGWRSPYWRHRLVAAGRFY